MQTERHIVCVVGGGVWLRALCDALLEQPGPPLTLHLVARRAERLAIIGEDLRAHVAAKGGDLPIRTFGDLAEAATGASAVVLLLRVGGLAARAGDERLAQSVGHVGDEGLGIGGAANAWRTAPVLHGVIDTLTRVNPACRVLNLVAPLGITTRMFTDAGLHALGVCELPTVTAEAISPDIPLHYCGLNHLGWLWATEASGRRALARAVEGGLVDGPTLQAFGAAPLHYYYEVVDREAGQRLGRMRTPGRGDELAGVTHRAFAALAKEPGTPLPELSARRTPWFDRALAPLLSAWLGGPPLMTTVNRVNGPRRSKKQLPFLAGEAIVETRAHVHGRGVTEVASPPPPLRVQAFLHGLAEYECALYAAATHQDPQRLTAALTQGPWALGAAQAQTLAAHITSS